MLDPVELTAALVRCPSLTPSENGCFAIIEEVLRPLGFHTERLLFAPPDGPPVDNLFASLGTGAPHLCFNGHVDVVPPGDRRLWSDEPFAGRIADGQVYGRGAADMKSAIAAFLAAAARHCASDPPKGGLSLLITADEEGPATHGSKVLLAWAAQRGCRFDGCVVGEPTSVERLGDTMKIGRRGSLRGVLSVHGRQGHTAYPQRADNAAHRLVAMLGRLLAQPIDAGTTWFQPSDLQITSIDIGNPAANVIPASARAAFNIRYNDTQNQPRLEAWLRARLDESGGEYTLEMATSGDAFLTRPGPLAEMMAEAVASVTGRRPEPSTTGGTSDARFAIQYCPVIELGLVGTTMHQADERVAIADIVGLTEIYARFLGRWYA